MIVLSPVRRLRRELERRYRNTDGAGVDFLAALLGREPTTHERYVAALILLSVSEDLGTAHRSEQLIRTTTKE